jgi:hypothetical protein
MVDRIERGLENRWACKRPLGSNPSPAAKSPINTRIAALEPRPCSSAYVRVYWGLLAHDWRMRLSAAVADERCRPP